MRLQLEFADVDDAAGALLRDTSGATIVDQAVGAVMETNGCSEAAARELLRSAAGRREVTEREVATTVLRSSVAVGTGTSSTTVSPACDDRCGDGRHHAHQPGRVCPGPRWNTGPDEGTR
ncbi:ANTAR domain-containing protein [Isoptericola rhizosphaerae]|uniref:ANTAR domain-containing protein n=1 Tax=Isoptericola rhizosphaerae TaxID=3377837 RepID=UPI00383A0F45